MIRPILTLCLLLSTLVLSGQSLEGYWKMAAENNPSLKASFNKYLAALERVDQQGSLPDPNLSFGVFISPVETRVGAQRLRMSVSQMFPWMGTLEERKTMAVRLAEASFAEFEEARNALFLKVSETWLQLLELEKEIALSKENLKLLRSYEPIVKTKYEANLTSLADLIRVQIRIEEASTQLTLLELRKTPLISDFNTYLNRPVDTPVILTETLPVNSEASVDSVLVKNPKVIQNQYLQQAAQSQLKLNQLKRKPSLGVGLDYVFVSERTDMAVADNGKNIIMPMVSMSLPIFGKKNKAQIKEAELMQESLQHEAVGIKNTLKNEWTKATYLEQSAEQELQLYASEIDNTKALLNVLTSEYSNNSSNFEELLMTQQRLLQLQIAEARSQTRQQRSQLIKQYLSGNFLPLNP